MTGTVRDMLRIYQQRLDQRACRTWRAYLERVGLTAFEYRPDPTCHGKGVSGMRCEVCGKVVSPNQLGGHFLQKAYRELSQTYQPHLVAVNGYLDALVTEFREACRGAGFTVVRTDKKLREVVLDGRKTDPSSVADAKTVIEVNP